MNVLTLGHPATNCAADVFARIDVSIPRRFANVTVQNGASSAVILGVALSNAVYFLRSNTQGTKSLAMDRPGEPNNAEGPPPCQISPFCI